MGGDRTSPALVATARELAYIGVTTIRFDFPYRLAGKKSPDSEKVLRAQFLEAIDIAVRKCAARNKSSHTIKVVVGGRSMGGRIASVLAAELGTKKFDVALTKSATKLKSISATIIGCALMSYPLHAPGKTEMKDKHFSGIAQKCIFVSGTRDVFATPAQLKRSAKKIKGTTQTVFLDEGDHELKTRKDSDVTFKALNEELAFTVTDFVAKYIR